MSNDRYSIVYYTQYHAKEHSTTKISTKLFIIIRCTFRIDHSSQSIDVGPNTFYNYPFCYFLYIHNTGKEGDLLSIVRGMRYTTLWHY